MTTTPTEGATPREATTQLVVKSVTVGVDEPTLDAFQAAGTKVGAPSAARIATTGGPVYDPANGTADNAYPYSVTFTWAEQL